ncbi:MAG: bifunctional precorrin-2 dehydrogenase/sirohydrochlorin ferrochelatase [Alphaproteobacteria bacterium]|jgi:precorrin-2 dehydrogenase/sirohydrochlorin ferrochelatase|nr:bifunctional precorrin-2 dehydrogenase/sirohydrochlorin ferrochelatase [Alphaproteobacteria bacterium]
MGGVFVMHGYWAYHNGMADLPVMLSVSGRRAVVVGGGAVAARRAATLVDAGAAVTVIAPEVDDSLADLEGIDVQRRAYKHGDVRDAAIVVIATDNPSVNARVAADAEKAGVLTNRTDDAHAGDVAIPAHRRFGPLTIGVSTDGISAAAAGRIADELVESLDPTWPRLLAAVAPYRDRAQAIADPAARHRALRAMVDDEARGLFAESHERFEQHCQRLIEQATNE